MEKKKIAFVTSSPSTVNAFLTNHIKELSKVYDVSILSNVDGFKEKPGFYIWQQKECI